MGQHTTSSQTESVTCAQCGSEQRSTQSTCRNCESPTEPFGPRAISNSTSSVLSVVDNATDYFRRGEFVGAAVVGGVTFLAGLSIVFVLVATMTNHGTGYSDLTFSSIMFYAGHFVSLTVGGHVGTYSAIAYALPALLLPIASLGSRLATSDPLLEHTLGLTAGYLVFALVGALTLAAGTVAGDGGAIRYQVDLVETILFMGLGFPLFYGLLGGLLPEIRSGALGLYPTLGYGLVSPMAIPVVGGLLAMYSGRVVVHRHKSRLGHVLFLWGVFHLLVPALVLVFATGLYLPLLR